MPATIPLYPAPITTTFRGLYSSIEKSPKVNGGAGVSVGLEFAEGGVLGSALALGAVRLGKSSLKRSLRIAGVMVVGELGFDVVSREVPYEQRPLRGCANVGIE